MEELLVTSSILVSQISQFLCFIAAVIDTNLIDILDGTMVMIAMYTINIGHPGMLLGSFRNKQLDANGKA